MRRSEVVLRVWAAAVTAVALLLAFVAMTQPGGQECVAAAAAAGGAEWEECAREVREQQRGAVRRLQSALSKEEVREQWRWCHSATQHVCKVNYPDEWQKRRDLRRVLAHVVSVFARYRMTYWIEYGTLLGAVRHGDIIPWDLDVDVGVLDRELAQHWDTIRRDLGDADDPRDLFRCREMGKRHRNRKLKVSLKEEPGFYVDIYPWLEDGEGEGDELTAGQVEEVAALSAADVGRRVRMLRRAGWDVPLQVAHVENRDVPHEFVLPVQSFKGIGDLLLAMPARPEPMLDWRYGPTWRVPKPEHYYRPDLQWGSPEMMALSVAPTYEDVLEGAARLRRLGFQEDGLELPPRP